MRLNVVSFALMGLAVLVSIINTGYHGWNWSNSTEVRINFLCAMAWGFGCGAIKIGFQNQLDENQG